MMRLLPLIIFLALVAVLGVRLVHKNTTATEDAFTGKPFPQIKLNSAEKNKADFSHARLRGHVTLVNFFASWCAPCMAEQPELRALKKQFPALVIEGVIWNDEPEKLRATLKKSGDPYTNLWVDTNGEAAIALGIRGIPESYFIDSNGIVRYHLAGALAPDLDRETLIPLLTQMEKESGHAN